MAEKNDRMRDVRHTQNLPDDTETQSRAGDRDDKVLVHRTQEWENHGGADRGGAELHIDESAGDGETLPPPSAHRADTVVRATGPDARQQMERGDTISTPGQFAKGIQGPPIDQSRYPYTAEDMDELLTEAPRGGFPDTPGGDGATPLSADRATFLAAMGDRGHFPSQKETEKWARAVFNALRQRAIEKDDALAAEFKDVVRFGEAPEVQVEEMMWGGDFVDRMMRSVTVARTWSRAELYEQVAEEGQETPEDPWVDAAVHSFFGTLKAFVDDPSRVGDLGELQEIWDRA